MCFGKIRAISMGRSTQDSTHLKAYSPDSVALVTRERVQAEVQVFIREGNRGGWPIPSAPG